MANVKYYVWATDKCLSGWGVAEGKIHKQIAECETEAERDRMLRGFRGSNEFKYVNWDTKAPRFSSSRYTSTSRPASHWTRFA